jgi:diguanylate cyclase (GGDEF)-like protein
VNRWLERILVGDHIDDLQVEWREANGGVRDVSMVASDLRHDPEIAGVVLTGRDVSHHVLLEAQLKHDASHDVLTGLANRAAFTRAASDERQPSAVVAFVDVDDFKDINDALGHEAGDLVLVEVAKRLSKCVRRQDLVARLGGDEFGILLHDATDLEIATVADRIVGLGGSELSIGNSAMNVSLSAGFARLQPGLGATDGLRNADLAMYQAKRAGKGRYELYSPDMLVQAERRLDVRARLASAATEDAFQLAYQNIVRTTDGVVSGREALLRWEQPDGSSISPLEFIPLAEKTGSIVEIGEWVLRTACQDAMDWAPNADGILPLVSVNVSAVQLKTDFASVVVSALHESGLPADRLQLELTESLMAESGAATAFQELGGAGVRLAIDDFGTGYCSLAYLKKFSVDVIKIDRELIHGSSQNPRLLGGIAGLISAVGATALAEGVEEPADRELLIELGIPLAQGYLWHRPSAQHSLQHGSASTQAPG